MSACVEVKGTLANLEELEAGVGILNAWDTTIRVDRDERFLFDLTKVQELALIWDAELFEDDGHTPWVWTLRK